MIDAAGGDEMFRKHQFKEKNLLYLCSNNPHLKVSREKPDGLAIDLANGTWSFELDLYQGNGPFRIGQDIRSCDKSHQWGPIGVYDTTKLDHIQNMIKHIQNNFSA